jgi:hypothetical protein
LHNFDKPAAGPRGLKFGRVHVPLPYVARLRKRCWWACRRAAGLNAAARDNRPSRGHDVVIDSHRANAMNRPRLLLLSIATAFLAAGGTAARTDDDPPPPPSVLSHRLSEFGHLTFGAIHPFHDDPRCLMWWGSDAVVCEVRGDRLVPASPPGRLAIEDLQDRVVYVDADHIVLQHLNLDIGHSVSVCDTTSMELLDRVDQCRHFVGWLDGDAWVGIDDHSPTPQLVVRRLSDHTETRIEVPDWEGSTAIQPLFLDSGANPTVGIYWVLHTGDHFGGIAASKVCVCEFDINEQHLVWSRQQEDAIVGWPLDVSSIALDADSTLGSARCRNLVTRRGVYTLTYDENSISVEPLLRTPIQSATFDEGRDRLWYLWEGAIHRLEIREGVIEVNPIRPPNEPVTELSVLANGRLIASTGGTRLHLEDTRRRRWQTQRVMGYVPDIRFSPSGRRCVLSSHDAMVFEIEEDTLTLEAELSRVRYCEFVDEDTITGTQYEPDINNNEVATASIEHSSAGLMSRPYARAEEPDIEDEADPWFEVEAIDLLDGRRLYRGYSGNESQELQESQDNRYFLVEVRDGSVYEIPFDFDENTELVSLIMLDRDSLLGLARPANASSDAEYQLLEIDESGTTTEVGIPIREVIFDESDWYDPALKPTPDRRYCALLTNGGLVRIDTQSWEYETMSPMGLNEPLRWQITPQGDGMAWVKDATLYFTRLVPQGATP